MKSTPKSCSCAQCRAQRASKLAGRLMTLEERAFRRAQKQLMARGREELLVVAGVRRMAA